MKSYWVSSSKEFGPDADVVLMARLQQSDEQALEQLYGRYSKLVYSIAVRVLRDPTAAEDVLQEVFMKIWRNPGSFVASEGSFAGWLAVVSRNQSISVLRGKRSSDRIEDLTLVSPYNLAYRAEQYLMHEKAGLLIQKLPADQRKMLDMAFFEGMTHSEIATETGYPLGTIKTRIRSALSTLRKCLQVRPVERCDEAILDVRIQKTFGS